MTRLEAVRLPRIDTDTASQTAPGAVGCARPLWGGAARDPARNSAAPSFTGHHEGLPDGNRTVDELPQERTVAIVLREPQFIKGVVLGGWRRSERVAHAGSLPPGVAARPENALPERLSGVSASLALERAALRGRGEAIRAEKEVRFHLTAVGAGAQAAQTLVTVDYS